MSVISLADGCGDEMVVKRLSSGMIIPVVFNETTIENFPNFQVRDDDMYLCSYPKAGCHWTYEIMRLIVFGVDAHKDQGDKEKSMVEFSTEEDLNKLPSPRILNHHFPYDHNPSQLAQSKAKVVYVYRNPKDLVVSFYHHVVKFREFNKYTGSFSNFLKRFAVGLMDCGGDIFEYIKTWEHGVTQLGPRAIVLCYEEMKKDLPSQIRRLADFLEVKLDDPTVQRIAELTDFSSMQARKKVNADSMMMDELGNHTMYRKGQVGDWKNYFTVAESEWLDQLIQKRLSDAKFHKFTYTL